jgi:hypothetical protein
MFLIPNIPQHDASGLALKKRDASLFFCYKDW